MKLIVIFLLLSPTLFSQINYRDEIYQKALFDSLIKGNWQLTQVDIVDGYNIISDTNRFTSQESRNKKITFTSDSIYNHRDTTLRYYIRFQNYSYKIIFDSIMHSTYLKLYSGKGRKLHEEENYEIIKCSIDELIIKSNQFLHDGLDYTSISIVYTYRKDGVTDLLNKLSGDWLYCSDHQNSFMTENDSLTYEFIRGTNDSICQKSDIHLDLKFKRKNYENEVVIFEYNEVFGGGSISNFNIDPNNNLIYIMSTNKSFVYNFEVVNNEKLVLSLNMERTLKINPRNTR